MDSQWNESGTWKWLSDIQATIRNFTFASFASFSIFLRTFSFLVHKSFHPTRGTNLSSAMISHSKWILPYLLICHIFPVGFRTRARREPFYRRSISWPMSFDSPLLSFSKRLASTLAAYLFRHFSYLARSLHWPAQGFFLFLSSYWTLII